VHAEKIQRVDTAFESSEFRLLLLEATDDSLSRALELFNVPGGVDVTLRGRPPAQTIEEVISILTFLPFTCLPSLLLVPLSSSLLFFP